MTTPTARKRALATIVVIAMLIISAFLLGSRSRAPATAIEKRVIAPVQRVVAAPAVGELLPDLIEKACPAIVSIRTEPASEPAAHTPQTRRSGTVISADGVIVTTARGLVAGGRVNVGFNDGRIMEGIVALVDPLSNLSLIRVDARNLSPLRFLDADLPRVGTEGVVLTSPKGQGCTAVTAIVEQDFASEGQALAAWVQVGSADRAGAEGAPFIGRDGGVIAITGVSGGGPERSVSLPGIVVARVLSDMLRGARPPAAPFGIVASDMAPIFAARVLAARQRGAVAVLVAAGSNAASAGLLAGDVILSAGNAPVAGQAELARALGATEAGITLEIQRRGQSMTIALVP